MLFVSEWAINNHEADTWINTVGEMAAVTFDDPTVKLISFMTWT